MCRYYNDEKSYGQDSEKKSRSSSHDPKAKAQEKKEGGQDLNPNPSQKSSKVEDIKEPNGKNPEEPKNEGQIATENV
jgi:hypothetical protein